MKNPEKKFGQLISPLEIKKITSQCQRLAFLPEPKIKIIKSYLDKRSYSLVASFDFKKLKAIGAANSDGFKKYSWQVSQSIFPCFKKNRQFSIPEPFCYNRSFYIFFREYQKGKTLAKLLSKPLPDEKRKLIKDLLCFLPNIKPIKPKKIKQGIFLNDLEKNINILTSRKKENILTHLYPIIKSKIINCYAQNKEKFFVHGDFNPHNIFIRKSSLSLIDMEKAHWGIKEEDAANFIAHLKYSKNFGIKSKDLQSWKKITYSGLDAEKLKIFEEYFGILISSHLMIWGDYQLGLKTLKKINIKKL